ncbi:MAG: hypothetical protein ACC642_00020 [Pseudomonadales bacterium]
MARLLYTARDDEWLQRWYEEDGRIWYVRDQFNRVDVLALNAELRKMELRKSDGMRWALSIPEEDFAILIKALPELDCADVNLKHRAWVAFQLSSLSEPYRVQDKARGRTA